VEVVDLAEQVGERLGLEEVVALQGMLWHLKIMK